MSIAEHVETLPDICGNEDAVASATAKPSPYYLNECGIDFSHVRSAFACALHMHQPLIPAGEMRRLILLPVDPYLLYVYWDLSETQPPPGGARAVLRFQESGRVFDHEVDLAAGSSYVPLWSANKGYRADLGWQAKDGSFMSIVQSNVVETPRAWPHAAPEAAKDSATSGRSLRATSNADTFGAQDAILPLCPVEQPLPQRLQKTVAELYAHRAELPPVEEPVESEAEMGPAESVEPEPFYFELPGVDLTDYAEERFVPGISSARDPLVE